MTDKIILLAFIVCFVWCIICTVSIKLINKKIDSLQDFSKKQIETLNNEDKQIEYKMNRFSKIINKILKIKE
jgi:hypothetical protein